MVDGLGMDAQCVTALQAALSLLAFCLQKVQDILLLWGQCCLWWSVPCLDSVSVICLSVQFH